MNDDENRLNPMRGHLILCGSRRSPVNWWNCDILEDGGRGKTVVNAAVEVVYWKH